MFVNLGRTLFYRKLEPFQREIVLILQPSRCLRIHRGPSVKQKRAGNVAKMVVRALENRRKEGVVHSWRPKVAMQMWVRDPCPLCARKIRQPEVHPLPSVCTKREISGLHLPAAPTLCQQSAQERGRCPSKLALHSPNIVSNSHRQKFR